MTSELNAIRAYLAPPAGSFWKWSEDGDAVVWTDNRTIAFRPELEIVLRRHVARGLPPFGPVVLLLAACRDSWTGTSNQIATLQNLFSKIDTLASTPHGDASHPQRSLGEIMDQLNRVHAFPAELRRDPHARAELVSAVFETARARTTPETAASVVEAIGGGISPELLEPHEHWSPTVHRLLFDLQHLGEGLRNVDADQWRMRYATGLERDVRPAEVDEPLAKKVRALFERLQNDDELSGLTRLARDLMAIVHLPRPLDLRDEIPVGGVSDITNRGELDRLLISELAQDDETLMLRVAMNEALFLRRETPPRTPPRSRLLVLDAGLRMWGVPRVFATSVALSLAALCDPAVDLSVLRPQGDRLQPVDLSTRDGLLEHLKTLEPEVHPGRALAELSRLYEDADCETDAILITGDDVVADRDFRRALAENDTRLAFIITVARNGDFRMWQSGAHGTKLLREATLNLNRLLAEPRRPAHPLIDPELSTDLPAILRIAPFPLRLTHHVNPRQTWWLKHEGVLSIANDRRLMHWDKPLAGGRQLCDRLPSRQLLWTQRVARHGKTRFVVGHPGKPELWLVTANLESGDCDISPLDTTDTPLRCVCEWGGVLFAVHKRKVDVCDMQTGDRLQTVLLPPQTSWINGRFFIGPMHWLALSYDGKSARFEEVISTRLGTWPHLLTMFDVEGVQGPVGVSGDDGSLLETAAPQLVPLQKPLGSWLRVHGIARNGQSLCIEHGITSPPFRQTVLVNVKDRSVRTVSGDFHEALEPNFRQVIRGASLRNHFWSVGADGSRLVLETRHRRFLWLELGIQDRLRLRTLDHDATICWEPRAFVPVAGPPNARYRLRAAAFPDGSKIFLDSRGLLHLKSSNAKIPETTIVIFEQALAGWCADGRTWGPQYFFDKKPNATALEIWNTVLVPFASRLT